MPNKEAKDTNIKVWDMIYGLVDKDYHTQLDELRKTDTRVQSDVEDIADEIEELAGEIERRIDDGFYRKD